MSSTIAIYYFLKHEKYLDVDKWFTVKEVSKVISLSVDRTRRHLSLLVYSGDLETKVDGWCNVYRFKKEVKE